MVHLTIDRDVFSAALAAALRVVPARSPLVVTTGLFIRAEGGALEVAGTDLEVSVKCQAPVMEVYSEGEAVVPARQIAEIVRRISEGTVEIKGSQNDLVLLYPGGEARMAGFPPEEFPLMPASSDSGVTLHLRGGLKEALRSVLYAAGKDELRPVFTGVQFELRDGMLTLAATDAHRLAVYEVATDVSEPCSCVIPAKALREVERALSQGEEQVKITLQQNQATFVIGEIEVYTRLIDGRFPDWRAAVPHGRGRTSLGNDMSSLIKAIERAQVLAASEASTVIVRASGGKMTVHSQSDLGGLNETVPLHFEGEDVEIAFNANYLLEALKAAGGGRVEMELNGSMGPAVIRTPGSGGYLALVLPLRII
ncbi:MAG: DNA polymerase III subunit beta [Firmicutes bacterium]|nr:DNA polymerase III subunit beta [Bacillota bacterium]